MKVLHVITKSNWGGAQRCVYNLAIDARAAGAEVAVALGGDGPLAAKLREAGIQVSPLPTLGRDISLAAELRAARDLWRVIGEARPDVLHLHSSKAGGLGALVGRLRRVPAIVFTAHGWAFNEPRPNWQRAVIRGLHVATALLAHRTIAVAAAIPRQLGWRWLVGRRFAVIPNGIEAPRFPSRGEARNRVAAISPAAAEALAAPGGLACVTLAELHRVKGLDALIEAAADLGRRYPEISLSFVVFGEGEERQRLEALVAERGLAGRFVLAGFTPDATTLLPAFDIFALPSRSEALPMSLLEAGAAGLPAVASRVGGVPEVIANQETGLLVSPDRPRELAEALRRLAEDEALRERLGAALRQRVSDRFSRERASTATLGLYRELLGERR